MKNPIIESLESNYKKAEIPQMNPGDTVKVFVRIVEGNKERIQAFEGTIIKDYELLNEDGKLLIHYPEEDALPDRIGNLELVDKRVYGRSDGCRDKTLRRVIPDVIHCRPSHVRSTPQ